MSRLHPSAQTLFHHSTSFFIEVFSVIGSVDNHISGQFPLQLSQKAGGKATAAPEAAEEPGGAAAEDEEGANTAPDAEGSQSTSSARPKAAADQTGHATPATPKAKAAKPKAKATSPKPKAKTPKKGAVEGLHSLLRP